jgi:hypothetical protein
VLRRSTIRDLGRLAVGLSGGDRVSLGRGGHVVEDCRIFDFGRWQSAYQPGVHIQGVANTVRNTEIANTWQQAVTFAGNDHIIEGNHIHHVALELYDGAAVYAGRDFTWRGNAVRSNLFQAIGRPGSPCDPTFTSCHRHAVYMDDHLSGLQVFGNVFDGSEAPPAGAFDGLIGIFVNGGRDHNLSNNLFIANTVPLAIVGNAPTNSSNCGSVTTTLWQRLAAVPWQSELWASRYPRLATLLDEQPCWPLHNSIGINVVVNSSGPPSGLERYYPNLQGWAHGSAQGDPAGLNDSKCFEMGLNLVSPHPGFISGDPVGSGDFRLAPGSKAWAMGWTALPQRFGPRAV